MEARNLYRPQGDGTRAEAADEAVVGVVAYVDTLAVCLPSKLPAEIWHELRRLNGAGEINYYDKKERYRNRELLIWHQPTREALAFANRTIKRYSICGIEFGPDFIVRNERDALTVAKGLDSGLIKIYGRRGCKRHIQTSAYWQLGRKGRGLSVYPSAGVKPSKITGGPCARVELRFAGTKYCEKLDIYTFHNVLNLDLEELSHEHLHLYRVRPKRLAKMLRNRFDLRKLNRLRRDLGLTPDQGWDEAEMQELKDRIPRNIWNRCRVRIDIPVPNQSSICSLSTSDPHIYSIISQSRFPHKATRTTGHSSDIPPHLTTTRASRRR